MNSFPPAPPNDFYFFIKTYYEMCRSRFSKIDAIAGKWEFEDLIPGLSDFDSRFICNNDMSSQDWCDMSMAVGSVHLELCKKFPQWIRILEHLPGINITWQEMTDEFTYYPEYMQWSFYHTSDEKRMNQATEKLGLRKWDKKDEYFHLKKFLTYYGPYDRNIDIPINLGAYAVKYPLHSRIMHYFNPPVQSAISLINRTAVRGKKEAFRLADEKYPHCRIFRDLLELVEKHYEEPQLYEQSALFFLEGRMFGILETLGEEISENLTLFQDAGKRTVPEWKEILREINQDASISIFENTKFSRLMKGRLFFYVNAPDYFDSIALIRNELNRIGKNFFIEPFSIFWKLKTGEKIHDPSIILKDLSHFLTQDEIDCALQFSELTDLDYRGKEKEIAKSIIEIYDGFYSALHRITEIVKEDYLKKNESQSVSI